MNIGSVGTDRDGRARPSSRAAELDGLGLVVTGYELQQLVALASEGNADAMQSIGVHYNIDGDLDEAMWWFQAAANAGDVGSIAYVGWMYEMLGNTDDAIVWVQRAATAWCTCMPASTPRAPPR